MDRKEFLRRSMQVGCGCTAMALLGTPALASEEDCEQEETDDQRAAFTHQWVESLLNNMDDRIDDDTVIALMVASGRACAKRTMAPLLEPHKGDLDGFLAMMAPHFPNDGLKRDGNRITLAWDRCLCPMVGGTQGTLPKVYCHCSEGWMHEVFESIIGKPVDVHIVKAIKRGDPRCVFTIDV